MDTVFAIQDRDSIQTAIDLIQVFLIAVSTIVSVWIVLEAVKMRKIAVESDVVYYLEAKNSNISAIVENNGRSEAYNVHIKIDFSKGKPKRLKDTSYDFEYIAPNQKYSFFLGHILLNGGVTGFSSHKVIVEWYINKKLTKKITKVYNITEEQAVHLYNNSQFYEVNRNLERIASAFERGSRKL